MSGLYEEPSFVQRQEMLRALADSVLSHLQEQIEPIGMSDLISHVSQLHRKSADDVATAIARLDQAVNKDYTKPGPVRLVMRSES